MNCRDLGLLLVLLGGGRKKETDILDLSVGLENVLKIGDEVNAHRPFATLHCNDISHIDLITKQLNNIIKVCEKKEDCKKISSIYAII